MNFLYEENNNVYELINYYKNIHKYYIKNKNKIYNILKGLDNQIIIEDDKNNENNENDFSNFYFFYIQNIKSKREIIRNSFRLNNSKQIYIKKNNDFLVGLNFSKCEIGSQLDIFVVSNINKKIFNLKITEKNKNNIFLPINNKNFFPFFLVNDNLKLIIYSNKNIPEIDAIYLKLHQNYSNKFLNYGNYLINLNKNIYIEFNNYNVRIIAENYKIFPNEFIFYWDLENYYSTKIYKYIKKYKLKKTLKQYIDENHNIYKDISNIICKYI